MALLRHPFGPEFPRRLAAPVVLSLLAGGLLVGCASAPYLDSRREAGQKVPVGPSNANLVVICFSKTPTAQADVLKLAESECAKTNRVPKLDREERWSCTMKAPRRIIYSCVAKP